MPKQAREQSSAITSWWLGDGDEECPHCGRLYVYEVEVRCADCDGAVCRHCRVTHAQGHLVCLDCAPLSPTKQVSRG